MMYIEDVAEDSLDMLDYFILLETRTLRGPQWRILNMSL
jgi:hypothetical protein